jgi:hypothetical protein
MNDFIPGYCLLGLAFAVALRIDFKGTGWKEMGLVCLFWPIWVILIVFFDGYKAPTNKCSTSPTKKHDYQQVIFETGEFKKLDGRWRWVSMPNQLKCEHCGKTL